MDVLDSPTFPAATWCSSVPSRGIFLYFAWCDLLRWRLGGAPGTCTCRCDEYGEQCCKPEEGRQVQVRDRPWFGAAEATDLPPEGPAADPVPAPAVPEVQNKTAQQTRQLRAVLLTRGPRLLSAHGIARAKMRCVHVLGT